MGKLSRNIKSIRSLMALKKILHEAKPTGSSPSQRLPPHFMKPDKITMINKCHYICIRITSMTPVAKNK
jgi:hypothetical protein